LRERLQVFFEKNIFLSRKNAISLPSETGDKIAEETPRLLASLKMNKQLIFTANNKRIMANLVNANAANAAQVVKGYAYNRSLVKAGILHFGVGNFHRAHLEFMTNMFLENNTQQNWGICGAMILPGDERLYHALKKQDGEYTLTVCGRDDSIQVYQLGALVELYWGVEEQEQILNKIASKDIKIITLTITEGGYNISRQSGEFMLDNAQVAHDIENPAKPVTAFGYVAEGLRRRKAAGNGPITILSCDNLQHNGNTARKAFMTFVGAQDKELAAWMEENVTFPNSMVDRITPATRPADIERLRGYRDALEKFHIEYQAQDVLSPALSAEEGSWVMERFLEKDVPFDAVFGFTETAVLGAKSAIQKRGLRIPEDVALCCMSGTALATLVHPQLTVVEQPIEKMAQESCRLLLEHIADGYRRIEEIALRGETVIREST
jgi:hypothetical protein